MWCVRVDACIGRELSIKLVRENILTLSVAFQQLTNNFARSYWSELTDVSILEISSHCEFLTLLNVS